MKGGKLLRENLIDKFKVFKREKKNKSKVFITLLIMFDELVICDDDTTDSLLCNFLLKTD